MTPDDNKRTPEQKKNLFADKLSEPAKPVITQVVPVAETKKANYRGGREHINFYVSPQVGQALRQLRVDTRQSVQEMLEEATLAYLAAKGVQL